MATTIFNLRDDENQEEIDIDELYEKKRQADLSSKELFNKILNRIHNKIKKVSTLDKNATHTWYVIPEFIMGVPKYDIGICIGYIIEKLRTNGFNIRYFHPNTVLISWEHWVPGYVREQVKKKLDKNIDGFGNIIPSKNNKEDDDPLSLFPAKTPDKPQKDFKSTGSYRPTGKFIYNTDYFK